MKAVVYEKYGSPDVLEYKEVMKPVLGDNEVLVKVQAASVNPLDWHALRGKPFFYRFSGAGILKPKNKILGADVAGVIESTGKNVSQFRPGDEVFGDLFWNGLGAFAEYAVLPENAVSLKPSNTTFEEAASVVQGSITALHCLQGELPVQPGQKVLVNGASGGVGVFVVQMAKAFGTEVTGVCSARNTGMVYSLGADRVIDYTRDDFTLNEGQYDLIVDNVGNHSISEYKRALSPTGSFILVGFSLALMLRIMLMGKRVSKPGVKKLKVLFPKENNEDLVTIKNLLESGKIKAVLDRKYPLLEVAAAIRYLEAGHARGKVVISV